MPALAHFLREHGDEDFVGPEWLMALEAFKNSSYAIGFTVDDYHQQSRGLRPEDARLTFQQETSYNIPRAFCGSSRASEETKMCRRN